MKKLDVYRDNQNKGLWRDEGNVESIENAKVLVVGLGDIGGEFAMRCKKLGAYCIGIRRTQAAKPDFVNELHTLEALVTCFRMRTLLRLLCRTVQKAAD